jgi:ABC-type sugar transport system permease subunit
MQARIKPPLENWKKRVWNERNGVAYLFTLPLIIAMGTFSFYPILESFRISFYKHDGVNKSFRGLANYDYILHDDVFWGAFYNTLYMGFLSVVIGVPLSFVVASLINAVPVGKSFFKAVFFAPNVTSIIAVTVVFMFLFYPTDQGLVNTFVQWAGFEPRHWFSDPGFSKIGIVIMDLWHNIGYSMLIWLAGIQSIPRDLYEAGEVDGANKFQQWLYITIPNLRPYFFFMVVIGTINAFKRFGDVFIIGGVDGMPGGSLTTLMTYMYRLGFQVFEFGRSAAASFIMFAIIIIFTLINFQIFREKRS